MSKDWLKWHEDYKDGDSELSQRLSFVQEWLGKLIDEGKTSVISICGGQGDDILGALKGRSDKHEMSVNFIELDGNNIEVARRNFKRAGLSNVRILQADAGLVRTYRTIPAADIVLACGIFGNVENRDIFRTIDFLPRILKHKGAVIWTRSRRSPDITPRIRNYFKANGYVELGFIAPANARYSVGVNLLQEVSSTKERFERIFTFVV